MNVSKPMLDEATAEQAFEYLLDTKYKFKESGLMYATAEKAGVSILSFYDIYQQPAHHRYDLADLEGLQMDGDMPRVYQDETLNTVAHAEKVAEVTHDEWNEWVERAFEHSPTTQEELKDPTPAVEVFPEKRVDVSTGVFAKAARQMKSVVKSNIQEAEKSTDAISKAVSGSHYNDVVPGFQYMEMMQHMLADKEGVESHLLGQVYKYLMRAGKKDDVEQEYRKARWYLNCLVKYKQTGEVDPNNND